MTLALEMPMTEQNRSVATALNHDRHPEARAKRASKGDGPGAASQCPSSFEARARARAPQDDGRRSSLTFAGAFFLACVFATPSPARAADAALYEAAKKEGQVVWYTTLIVNQAVRPMIEAFNRKYPGVEVKYARADSGPTAIKIINEARAGKPQSDVFDGIDTTPPLLQAGLAERFVPSEAGKYPPELKDPNGRWNALVVYFLTPAVNTSLVPKDEIPRKIEDFLKPRWKGAVAWSTVPASGSAVFVGSTLLSMGEEKGMALLRALARQELVNVDATNRAILDQVIFGQYAAALSIFNHHAVLSAKKGAPVEWLRVEPISAPTHAVGLVKNGPHPNAGKLLIDFLTSEEGQRVLSDVEYIPAMPSVPAKTPEVKPQGGGFKAVVLSPATITRSLDNWVKIKKELFDH